MTLTISGNENLFPPFQVHGNDAVTNWSWLPNFGACYTNKSNGYLREELSKRFWTIFVITGFAVFLKLLVSFASKIDFSFFKALTVPNPILTFGADNTLVFTIKYWFISFLTEYSSTTGWVMLCSNYRTSSSFSSKRAGKDLGAWKSTSNDHWKVYQWCIQASLGAHTLALKKHFSSFLSQLYFNKKYVKVAINDFTIHQIISKWLRRQKHWQKRKTMWQKR